MVKLGETLSSSDLMFGVNHDPIGGKTPDFLAILNVTRGARGPHHCWPRLPQVAAARASQLRPTKSVPSVASPVRASNPMMGYGE